MKTMRSMRKKETVRQLLFCLIRCSCSLKKKLHLFVPAEGDRAVGIGAVGLGGGGGLGHLVDDEPEDYEYQENE